MATADGPVLFFPDDSQFSFLSQPTHRRNDVMPMQCPYMRTLGFVQEAAQRNLAVRGLDKSAFGRCSSAEYEVLDCLDPPDGNANLAGDMAPQEFATARATVSLGDSTGDMTMDSIFRFLDFNIPTFSSGTEWAALLNGTTQPNEGHSYDDTFLDACDAESAEEECPSLIDTEYNHARAASDNESDGKESGPNGIFYAALLHPSFEPQYTSTAENSDATSPPSTTLAQYTETCELWGHRYTGTNEEISKLMFDSFTTKFEVMEDGKIRCLSCEKRKRVKRKEYSPPGEQRRFPVLGQRKGVFGSMLLFRKHCKAHVYDQMGTTRKCQYCDVVVAWQAKIKQHKCKGRPTEKLYRRSGARGKGGSVEAAECT